MGSCINDHCPWCGRFDQGGYELYGINYPICTRGLHNYLGKAMMGVSREAYMAAAFDIVIAGTRERWHFLKQQTIRDCIVKFM